MHEYLKGFVFIFLTKQISIYLLLITIILTISLYSREKNERIKSLSYANLAQKSTRYLPYPDMVIQWLYFISIFVVLFIIRLLVFDNGIFNIVWGLINLLLSICFIILGLVVARILHIAFIKKSKEPVSLFYPSTMMVLGLSVCMMNMRSIVLSILPISFASLLLFALGMWTGLFLCGVIIGIFYNAARWPLRIGNLLHLVLGITFMTIGFISLARNFFSF